MNIIQTNLSRANREGYTETRGEIGRQTALLLRCKIYFLAPPVYIFMIVMFKHKPTGTNMVL